MKHHESVALLAVLPNVSCDRTRRYAREFASLSDVKGMGLVLPTLVTNVPTWSPDTAASAGSPVVLSPISAAPPSWSPDLAPQILASAAVSGHVYQSALQAARNTAAQPAVSWWPPTTNMLIAGGGVLVIAAFVLRALRRSGRGSASAAAPIVVVSSKPAAPEVPAAPAATPVKANRPRFVARKGR